MPDLSFSDVIAHLPSGVILSDSPNSDVLISVKALLGESAVTTSDQKVSEALSKFLDGCSKAQTIYNADATKPSDLRTYNPPTVGVPVPDNNGQYAATFTYVLSVKVPLSKDATTAVESQV